MTIKALPTEPLQVLSLLANFIGLMWFSSRKVYKYFGDRNKHAGVLPKNLQRRSKFKPKLLCIEDIETLNGLVVFLDEQINDREPHVFTYKNRKFLYEWWFRERPECFSFSADKIKIVSASVLLEVSKSTADNFWTGKFDSINTSWVNFQKGSNVFIFEALAVSKEYRSKFLNDNTGYIQAINHIRQFVDKSREFTIMISTSDHILEDDLVQKHSFEKQPYFEDRPCIRMDSKKIKSSCSKGSIYWQIMSDAHMK